VLALLRSKVQKMFRPYGLEPKGRSYGAIKRGFKIIFSLCFDKLNMTQDATGGLIGHNYLILCAHGSRIFGTGCTGLVLGLKNHVTARVAKQSFYKQPLA